MTSEYVFRLPDIGEGLAGAEVVEWLVAVGDRVEEEQPIVEVLTDKANVEIVSPVTGTVERLGAAPGETVAVGAALVAFRLEAGAAVHAARPAPSRPSQPDGATSPGHGAPPEAPERTEALTWAVSEGPGPSPAEAVAAPPPPAAPEPAVVRSGGGVQRPLASPAVRRRAEDAEIDLRTVRGSGPAGRIVHEDLDRLMNGRGATLGRARDDTVTEVPVVGLRRRIAERLSLAASRIPHITYVEEVDVTEVERLRGVLNETRPGLARLTLLPFLIRAMVEAIADQPLVNATFDDDAGVLHQHSAVHVGIATQTPAGLVVPVVRYADTLDPWSCAAEIERLATAARAGTATREELTGSTITVTSLGRLGGLATTPIINHPEVAIVGVNKMQVRPLWDGHGFVPRTMMNLSSSFDHRIIDGVDAATFVQRVKQLLEEPAAMFVGGGG